ncbi:hypothetical protein [Niallia sp. FSL M8-0099]|uniref:hypothetical protein n=1 Tax=Niallia sp. FSL M8-0099 TaxID=2954519 RepID=UPI0030FB2DA0
MIQVTLNANEFNHSGVHNDREYTSLRVDRTSNGRVYFTTIKNGIRLSTMAKQMKLVNGEVIISFGKNDKLIIGTYVDTEAEQTQEVIEETEDNQQGSTATEEETITFTASKSLHGFGQSVWINDNRNTNNTMTYFNPKGNESVTIPVQPNNYDLYWEIEQYIQSIMKEHGRDSDFWSILINKLNGKYVITQSNNESPKKSNRTPSKPKQSITDIIPETQMLADYANILIDNNKVSITYSNDNQKATATFKYRKSWSMRKYIDYAFNNSNIKPSWEFKYGWEYLSK